MDRRLILKAAAVLPFAVPAFRARAVPAEAPANRRHRPAGAGSS